MTPATAPAAPAAPSPPLFAVTDLSRHFVLKPPGGLWARLTRKAVAPPRLHAVDGVSFAIGAAETVGLVGESGCGKSTLVRLITRLLDSDSGAIQLEGSNLAAVPARRFGSHPDRQRIQMVFQDAGESINPRHTAFAAIADPLKQLKRLRGAALTEAVHHAADQCGLPRALLSRFPHQLSGGQRARVGIARAVALRPAVLVLDEPTAALDVSVQVVILQLLERLKRDLGMSYLFVSHDLNVVRLLCDRVLVMYLGLIVEEGPAEALFANPLHPYTRALIAAVPRLPDEAPAERLRLTGEPRSPIDPSPTVCRFYGRCPISTDLCAQQMPPLRPAGNGQQVACHHATL